MNLCIEHAVKARALPDMSQLWKQVYSKLEGHGPNDVDQDLYNGFIGPADRRRLNQLRELSPQELSVDRTGFDDARLQELVFRWRAQLAGKPDGAGAGTLAAALHGGAAGWGRRCSHRGAAVCAD